MSQVEIQFYTNSQTSWDAMLADIAAAKVSIDFEQYIFSADKIGMKFIALLAKKAQEGIKIRMLCDTVGSLNFYRLYWPELLEKVGVQVRFFNPIRIFTIKHFTSNFLRDHRKIIVIDGQIGHIGGVGIQDDMAPWRDTHMRVIGPLVTDIERSFLLVWESIDKNIFAKFKRSIQFIKKYNILTNSPRRKQRYLYQAYIANMRNAQKRIYLATPYFIPDIRFYRVMRLAAKRGIDVRLITPEISDHPFVNHARESYFTLALKAGVRIYVYKNLMMHAKYAVIDNWATAGSFNLDSLSFLFNHEANIASTDPHFVDTLHTHFLEDLRSCREISYEEWIKRPLFKKFLELLTWPFHKIM